ncbi:MAG: Zn-ribbon domain-containing OB-fold protein [Streptosporangiaceae bacterium]
MNTSVAATYERPLPAITEDNEPFWLSAQEHALKLQQCGNCSRFRYFVSPICPNCGSFDFAWERISGLGTVYTFTVVERAPSVSWASEVPYVYAIVQVDEGPLLPTNIVGCDPAEVRIGMPVTITYDDVTEQITIPKFRPADES